MLILTRRLDEKITIGEGDKVVFVTILGVKGNQVRLGIDAPKSIPIHREEIYQKIEDEKTQGGFVVKSTHLNGNAHH